MPTIKDIAKAAGVSHSTVSNVLNNKPGVSSEKIRLVRETARTLGYRIDEQASLLRKGVTRTVAVILPDIRSPKYCDLYVGILRSLENRSYSARLFLTENMPYREKEAIDSAIAAKACAILSVTCLDNAEHRYTVPSLEQTPVLFLDRQPKNNSIPCFSFDYRTAGHKIALKVRESGYHRPGIFVGNIFYSPNHDFLEGVRTVFPHLSDQDFTEMKYGDRSTDAYLFLQEEDPYDCYITVESDIAERLFQVILTSGCHTVPSFFTLSSLRAIPDSRYHNLPLNYSQLGADGADAILNAVEQVTPLTSRHLSASRFLPLHASVPAKLDRPLKMLSLSSPTASALNCLLPEFTRQSGISVEIETHPLSSVYNYIQSGHLSDYDVLRLDVSNFHYMAENLLEPLDLLDTRVNEHLDRFLPGLFDNYGRVDGRLYALPFDISIQMLFYRRDLFEDAMQMRSFFEQTKHSLNVPKTFEEYNEIARFFTRKFRPDSPTPYGSSIALGTASSTGCEYLMRLLCMGGNLFDEHGLLHISTPKAKKALKSYLETADYANPTAIHSWTTASENFVHGETAMTILFTNHASGIIRAQNALSSNQVGFAPVPGFRPLLGGGSLGICSSSQRKQEAYQFIQWATGDEIAPRLMIMGGTSPCRSAYEHVEILNAYPWLRDFEKNLKMGSRKTILSNRELRLDLHRFETALGQLIIDAASKKRQLNETIWRAQQLLDQMLDNA